MKKWISLLLAAAMILTLSAGCGSSDSAAETEEDAETEETAETEESRETNETAETEGTAEAEETAETEAAEEEVEADQEETESSESGEENAETASVSALLEDYPRLCEDGEITLTMFYNTIPGLTFMETYSDLYFWQEVSSRTGITFDWYMASFANAEDQFNLLVAANDLPNIICTASYYSYGIASAIEDEVFVNLAPYLEAYAPDYLEVISEDDVWPLVSDDNGNVIAFYEVSSGDFPPNTGVLVRGDLLEEQGLDVPVTYEEYEEVLLTLKTAYDLEAPIYLNEDLVWLSSGKYIQEDFSLDADGNCTYGPVTDEYREYLSVVNRWYEEGLVYQDFYTIPSDSQDAYMTEYMSTGKSVLVCTYNEFAGNIELTDPDGTLIAGYLPRNSEEEQLHLSPGVSSRVNANFAFAVGPNSTEEEIQTACMLMNYFYTEEGALLADYGVEGVSFEYQEDGTPWYTEMITDNPDGLTQTAALIYYVGNGLPAWTDSCKYNISTLTDYADFTETWSTADNDWDMPDVSLTDDEQDAYNAVSADVETYLDETLIKFIIGSMDVDDDAVWQEYLDTLESLGVNTMIEVYTAALERYNAKIS